MATPSLTEHALPGALGEILVSVRAGGRDSPRPAVVLVHGFKGFRSWGFFPALADRLARAGFTVVTYNASGSGVDANGDFTLPDRFGHNTYSAELADLRTVLAALWAGELGVVPPSSLGLMGHSRGAGIALLQTAHDAKVRALVSWASIGSVGRWSAETIADWKARGRLDVMNLRTRQVLPLYLEILEEVEREGERRLDLAKAAALVEVPWLLLHGEEDDSVAVSDSETLYAANGKGTTELRLVTGAGHTFGATHPLEGAPETLDRTMRATLDWFVAHLT